MQFCCLKLPLITKSQLLPFVWIRAYSSHVLYHLSVFNVNAMLMLVMHSHPVYVYSL